jgi:hypothetical protein
VFNKVEKGKTKMRKITVTLLSLVMLLWAGAFTPPKQLKADEADIVVYGATSAGVIAAYTARKMGKTVILVEAGNHMGGMTSGGLGYTDIGNKFAISGLSLDFYRKIGKHYGRFEQWTFEPHVAKKYLQEYLDEVGVSVLYAHRIVSAKKQGKEIRSILVENSLRPSKATNREIKGKVFIDCSYEGDLMARAGVSFTVGREDNKLYNETINGVQLMKGHQFPDGIDPYIIPGDPRSGLVWGVAKGTLEPNGTGDSKVQAYNYRICLTSNPANLIPIGKPDNYDPKRYELLARLMAKHPEKDKLTDYLIWSHMPNEKTDINNRNGFSTDMIGANYDYPNGTYAERAKIIKAHEDYTKGLLYFMGNDSQVPQGLRSEIKKWGYPKDEYQENGNWSPQLYIREARRLVGSYVMTQANCEGKEKVEDGVGMAAYTMDSHNCQRIVVNGMVKNEGNVEIGGFGPYPISYRSLIPKGNECSNLLVPVCLSASHIAYGSIRMEPVFMVLAQSSAVAASLAIDDKTSVQKVSVPALQRELRENPLANGKTAEIIIDNDEPTGVAMNGPWKKVNRGGFAFGYLVGDAANSSPMTVSYKPKFKQTGRYKVYAYITKLKDLSPTIAFTIDNGSQKVNYALDTGSLVVIGQTSGEWYPIGSYSFSSEKEAIVELSNKRAKGTVVADAILFVPEF